MQGDRFYLLMFLAIIAALGYLAYEIFQPFLNAIACPCRFEGDRNNPGDSARSFPSLTSSEQSKEA
jgi:hypothetical protein